jgi:hypothetical protein
MNGRGLSGRGVQGRLLPVLAAAVLVAGCAAPASKTSASASATSRAAAGSPAGQVRLAVRLEAYHRALGVRDALAMFHMEPPYVQAHLKFEEFKHDLGMEGDWASLPRTDIVTRVNKTCNCSSGAVDAPGQPTVVRCLLLLDSTMTDANGKRTGYRNLEMWEYQKGEWYFGFPGGGADSCPEASADPD